MQNPVTKLSTAVIGLTLAVSAAGRASAPVPASARLRTFEFNYQVHVPATKATDEKLLVWVPLPQDDEYQKIEDLHIDSSVWFKQGHDSSYGNPFAEFHPDAKQLGSGFDTTIRFVAVRYEHKVPLDSVQMARSTGKAAGNPALQRFLEPGKLVPLDGAIADLAREHTAGDTTEFAKARHIYDYVVSTMQYDKTGEGWGRGDAVWACSSKRGNCTDFHSLLIGMMRARGISARFEIGFPLPAGKTEGDIPGYHCWAEFYLDGTGWIPVDASEAWKNPAKRDYFFGAHDENRVFFSYGRDLHRSPEQKGAPLNYFIYPYAELERKPFSGLQTHFSFHDLAAVQASSAN